MAIRISKNVKIILFVVLGILVLGGGSYLLWRINQSDTVAPTDSSAGLLKENCDFIVTEGGSPSLPEALSGVSEGGVVCISPGDYSDYFGIVVNNKRITIRGEGSNSEEVKIKGILFANDSDVLVKDINMYFNSALTYGLGCQESSLELDNVVFERERSDNSPQSVFAQESCALNIKDSKIDMIRSGENNIVLRDSDIGNVSCVSKDNIINIDQSTYSSIFDEYKDNCSWVFEGENKLESSEVSCSDYKNLNSCNEHASECAWYVCSTSCLPRGTTWQEAGCEGTMPEDINEDGQVSISDYTLYLTDLKKYRESSVMEERSDLDRDSMIGISDYELLLLALKDARN